MSTHDISFVEVGKDFDPEHLRGFISLYQRAYREEPYNEVYTSEQVEQDVWTPHLRDGCIVIALSDKQVIGLGCCVPADLWTHDEEFQEFIRQEASKFPAPIPQLCLMSEICVDSDFRHRGIGTKLVLRRIAWAKAKQHFSHYLMRTAEEGSNSKSMYLKLGALQISDLVEDVSSHAEKVNSDSKRRIFLTGRIV